MFLYVNILSSLFLLSCWANVIPEQDPTNVPNLFNLPGILANNRTDINFIEGDIAIPANLGRTAFTQAPRWDHGIVPYDLEGFNHQESFIIWGAMNKITEVTNGCIRFVWRENHPVWLRIHSGHGCWSQMGRVANWGHQDLSLQAPNCVHHGIVIHELLHALGFAHEQTRPDRDAYVHVYYENIQGDMAYNFDKFHWWQVNTFGQDYDFGSIMHYRNDAFSINGWATMKPILPGSEWWEHHMGRGDQMSPQDILKLKSYYGCP